MAMPEYKKHPKDELLEFTQDVAHLWDQLPRGDYERAGRLIRALLKRHTELDYSQFTDVASPQMPPLRRIG